MKDLEQAAAELRQYAATETDSKFTSDSMLVLEAIDILGLREDSVEHINRHTLVDSDEVCETDWLEYVLPDEEGDPTICVFEGQVYVGPIEEVKAKLNAEYAEKHGKVICKCCGSFERKRSGKADCENCGNLVDAAECLTSEQLEENLKNALTDVEDLGDGDYEHVWLLNERLETHQSKKNHSYVFIQVMYMDEHERDPDTRFYGEVKIVNIGMAGKAAVLEIKRECGIEGKVDSKWIAKELMSRGTCATVIQESGNSKVDVLQRIQERMFEVTTFGGYGLDKAQNAIGSTGWDFMKGDILAGLKRHQKTAAQKLMGKLTGIVAEED